MARAVFDGCNDTLRRESPETRREFEQNNQRRVTAGWEMVVPPPGPDGGSNFGSEGGPAKVNNTSVPFLSARRTPHPYMRIASHAEGSCNAATSRSTSGRDSTVGMYGLRFARGVSERSPSALSIRHMLGASWANTGDA